MKPDRITLLLLAIFHTILACGQLPPASPNGGTSLQPEGAPDAQSGISTLLSSVREVVLDVVVVDKHGLPAKGLKQSDFILSEDGVPQTINSFAERDAASAEATDPVAPPQPLPPNTFADHAPVTNDVAMTAIVFDTNEMEWQAGYYARYEVAQYLKSVKPGTPLCIFKLDDHGLQLIQDFTTDTKELKKAVESNRNAQWPQLAPALNQSPRGVALRQLAAYLSSFPGRKNLIWFGGGDSRMFSGEPGGLLPDMETFKKELEGATDTLTLNRVAMYTVDPRGVVMDPDEWADIAEDGEELSDAVGATGGKAFYGSNGLKQIVAQVVAAGSHYYTLSYRPTNTEWDGAFRHIYVQLADGGRAYLAALAQPSPLKAPLRLEYRSGYFSRLRPVRPAGEVQNRRVRISYSPRGDPNGPGAAAKTPLQQAMVFGAVAPFKIFFQVHITPARVKEKIGREQQRPKDNFLQPQWLHHPFRNYQIRYSVDPHTLRFVQPNVGSYFDTLEFVTVIYNAQGQVVNSIDTTAEVSLTPDQYVQVIRNGLSLDQPIAVPIHGDFYFRMGVSEVNSGRVGAVEAPEKAILLHPSAPPSSNSGQ